MVVWRRWVFPILMVVIFGLIAASLVKVAFFPDAEATAEVPTAIVTDPVVPVERGSIVNQLDVGATIARDEQIVVKSEFDATVSSVNAGVGSRVAAGQSLYQVRMEDPVRFFDIVAPIAGDVAAMAAVKGQFVSIGSEVATMTPLTYHALGTIEPVQLYRLIDAPTDATLTIAGGPAPFTCTGLTVQVAEDGTTSVRCAVPADQVVFAGLPATIGITVGTVTDALLVPTTAVLGGSGSGVVWLDDGSGEVEERTVALGISDGVNIEVTDGLAEGDMIRQFVPGVAVTPEDVCYEVAPGEEVCEPGVSW
jgi:multidrug efflux pump subunit AcrA (membrane-fusion protein)